MGLKSKGASLLEKSLARSQGNKLRDTIAESVEDGILTDSEETNIKIQHFLLYGALKNANDETLLPGETSPFFSQPFLDTNPHGGTPESILNLPRAGFEISGLNAISENGSSQAINLNLPSEITKHATSDIIPLSVDDLIAYLYSPHSQYNPITSAHSGTGSSATSGTGAVGGFIPPSDGGSDGGSPPSSGGSQGGGSTPPSGGSSDNSNGSSHNDDDDDDVPSGGGSTGGFDFWDWLLGGSGSDDDDDPTDSQLKESGNYYGSVNDQAHNESGHYTGDGQGNGPGGHPIILDLDGDGIQITELSNSTFFMDATGDGLANRTAWAAAGNGVLFYDPDNTGEITEMRQYVFTEWDGETISDMEALRAVFASNGDGVFDAAFIVDANINLAKAPKTHTLLIAKYGLNSELQKPMPMFEEKRCH